MMERTTAEILEKINQLDSDNSDFFGFQRSGIIEYLSFDDAKLFLKEGASREKWGDVKSRTHESIKDEILSYMPFAWEKANDNRGLSAGRSINHMQAWLWMMGEDNAAEAIRGYSMYGKPQLRAICEHFGWDWKQWDDGRWTNDESSKGISAPESVDALPFKSLA